MELQPPIRKTIGVILAATLVLIAYFGSFLPLKKSTAFVKALRTVGALSGSGRLTPDIFENIMAEPLLLPSPIGQEELVRQTAGMVMDLIRQGAENPEELVNFAESFYTPIIERGRGMSFSQNLYTMGLVHNAAAAATRSGRHLAIAQAYFEEGLKLSPNRPQFLYGLFDFYRMTGNFARAREVGEKILALWPEDELARKILKDLPEKNK